MLIPYHPLTNFEIQKNHQNEPRFNGVYSKDNLQKTKDGADIINLDEYSDIRTHWVTLCVQNIDVTLFLSELNIFQKRLEHLSVIKTQKQFFRIQTYNSIMCRYFCIEFLDFMLAGKTLTKSTNLFSPNNF